jgi:zinc protease
MDPEDKRGAKWLSGTAGIDGAAAVALPAPRDFADRGAEICGATLDNGLEVLVWPDHNIPGVVLNNWVRAGSRNEVNGTSGLAHFFEHMMFNGTERHGQGEFDRLLESRGASNNAYTSPDLTVYQDWFPRSALELVLELESDRLAHLALDPEVVENERQVVYSERRLRVEDSNAALLEEHVQATAFLAHPYRIPTIGWPGDIQSWTLADLQSFFAAYYAPGNCTVVLVGDLRAEESLELARRYFGAIPGRASPPPVRAREPEQLGERRLELARPGHNPLLHSAYHAIAATDPRAPALNLLQIILLGGEASRLHRALVEQQRLAVAISGGWPEGFDAQLFTLQATLPTGGSVSRLETALDGQLAALTQHGVSAQELQRAKNIVAADFWRAVSTIDGKARLLGEYAVLHGDYRLLFGAPGAYERVTREDVVGIARAVFDPRRRTVGILKPLS